MLQERFLIGVYLGVIQIENSTSVEIKNILKWLVYLSLSNVQQLANTVLENSIEKFDQYLPEELFSLGFGVKAFDIVKKQKRYNRLILYNPLLLI